MKDVRDKADFSMAEPYVPAWQRRESPVRVLDGACVNAELYENDGEVGVMMTGGLDIEFVKENAAIVFGESPEEIYFRMDFSTVVKMSCGDDRRQTLERLYKARVASFCRCDVSVAKTEYGIPVFHDGGELKFLAHHGQPDVADAFHLVSADLPGEYELEESTSVMSWSVGPVRHDDEVETVIEAEIAARDGAIIVRHYNDKKDRYSYYVAIVGNMCIVIMIFGLEGDWLGEEEPFNGEPPLWFSETDHTISPVHFAQKWRDLACEKIGCRQIAAIVIASGRSMIINEDELEDVWKDTCHVGVARTKALEGSGLPALKDYLDSLQAPKDSPREIHPDTIKEINEDFLRKCW